jgi:hypothetical protein
MGYFVAEQPTPRVVSVVRPPHGEFGFEVVGDGPVFFRDVQGAAAVRYLESQVDAQALRTAHITYSIPACAHLRDSLRPLPTLHLFFPLLPPWLPPPLPPPLPCPRLSLRHACNPILFSPSHVPPLRFGCRPILTGSCSGRRHPKRRPDHRDQSRAVHPLQSRSSGHVDSWDSLWQDSATGGVRPLLCLALD